MGATAFTHPLAKRIVASNAWVEQQRGIEGGNEEAPYSLQSGSMLIRTGTTLPTGYTGEMAVLGEIVERTFSGEYLPRMPIWIRDINGGTLSTNTVYQGVSGGSFTQDVTTNGIVTPTTYGLYVVQVGTSGAQSVGIGSFISGQVDFSQDGTSVEIIGYKITNVSRQNWRVTISRRYATAKITSTLPKTAEIVFFTSMLFTWDCQKTAPYTIVMKTNFQQVIDLMSFTYDWPLYFSSYILLLDEGDPYGFPKIVYAPKAFTTGGIGSGIGPGISGV